MQRDKTRCIENQIIEEPEDEDVRFEKSATSKRAPRRLSHASSNPLSSQVQRRKSVVGKSGGDLSFDKLNAFNNQLKCAKSMRQDSVTL
mmetsp:Transcript_4867/g.8344  ORF Transcript_4867/g.8344 Transcript_4867/m.8344 type:complete len:89 (-) Transcript_4867:1641-1907(-)